MRPLLFLAALLALTGPARAEPRAPIAVAITENRWADAENLARDEADPLAAVLVDYFHALAPRNGTDAPSAAAVEAVWRGTLDWPNRDLLAHRLADARASDPSGTDPAWCAAAENPSPSLLLRCADLFAAAGQPDAAADAARRAWQTGSTDPAFEAALMRRWGALVPREDQAARFDRLAWRDPAAAARQLARLPAADRLAATARLALRTDARTAAALWSLLPAGARSSPGVVFERLRWLRRANRDDENIALWASDGGAAEAAAPDSAKPLFWAERDLVARRALAARDYPSAYAIAAGHRQTAVAPQVDAEFLAGFIALRFLHDPVRARAHFHTLASLSPAVITQARAAWWLARAESDDPALRQADLARAAVWTTTFYGQLAAGRTAVPRDPEGPPEAEGDFLGSDVVRAAILLSRWGDTRRAGAFLRQAALRSTLPAYRAFAAELADALNEPSLAVAIAREAGRDGAMLPVSGWPVPRGLPGLVAAAGPADIAAVLAVIRQESSFDVGAISPSGARGLMQLMPATAAETARALGDPPPDIAALTSDARLNTRLGVAYLRGLTTRYDDSLPLAAAAYNAGPGRVAAWIAANGDPRTGAIDLVDWIELIPFEETRNYVQRVVENANVYRARLPSPLGARPLAQAVIP